MENSKPNHAPCPQCAKPCRAVKEIPLRSLLREEFRGGIEGKGWRFCTTPECPIVYFESGGTTFHKDQLTVRVGIKETTSPRPVCYCFHHSIEEIEDDIARTGKTGVLDDIKARMKIDCWCEKTSPLGGCCLATVNGFIKDAINRHAQSMPSAVPSTHDCCAVNAGHEKTSPATDLIPQSIVDHTRQIPESPSPLSSCMISSVLRPAARSFQIPRTASTRWRNSSEVRGGVIPSG